MKRKIDLEKKLPTFSISIDELDALWQILSKLFSENEGVRKTLTVKLPNEELEFSSIKEIQEYKFSRNNLSNFRISFYGDQSSISISTGYILEKLPSVSARSTQDGWCQYAIESTLNFIKNHKTWHGAILKLPIVRIFLLLLISLLTVAINAPSDFKLPEYLKISIPGTFISLFLVMVIRDKLIPGAIITTENNEAFYKKYVVEITLAIATISMIASVISIFK